MDFGGFGLKKASGGAQGSQKAAWGGPGDLQGGKSAKQCGFWVPFWGPFGAQNGPKTAPSRFENCKKKRSIFIAFLALGGSRGRLGRGRKTDRKTEPKKEAPYSTLRAVLGLSLASPAGYAGPGEGYGE